MTISLSSRHYSMAAAQGRKILSTAFVMVEPDGYLTVGLRDGRVLVLRDIAMRTGDYCGSLLPDDSRDTRFCGRYADVVAAKPGGGPTTDAPDPVTSDRAAPGSRRP